MFVKNQESKKNNLKSTKTLKKSKNSWLLVIQTYQLVFQNLNLNFEKNILYLKGCLKTYLDFLFLFNYTYFYKWFWKIFINFYKFFTPIKVKKKKAIKRRLWKRNIKKDFEQTKKFGLSFSKKKI